ncbi:MAG: SAM-dependent methyltransferase [Candidatus Eremiobacteraeota bacterium]|nr:SAM-dependent methyltransferase [Candidatus Eremiobacteraeota bacterium]
MALDERLMCVTTEVSPDCHADIGTDHALLPLYLLNNGICSKVVATEKSPNALRVAKQALWGRNAEVVLGDGLEPLGEIEFGSLSICGMGGSNICEILEAHPDRVPDILVVQANRDTHKVRRWAVRSGFHLVREQLAQGRWLYEILTFRRRERADPAYQDVDHELGFHFGPHLIKSRHALLKEELLRRRELQEDHPANVELQRVTRALAIFEKPTL